MMVVILTPVDGIIRWLPRGFSCSPNDTSVGEISLKTGDNALNGEETV